MSKKQEEQGPAIDIGFHVDMAAEIRAGFSGLRDQDRDRRAEEESRIPMDQTIRGGGLAPLAGSLIFSCGGPPLGRAWVLRRIAIAGTSPTSAIAGSAYFFASSAGDADQLITATWFDWASSLPSVGWYTSRQVVIGSGQQLWVVVVAPTPATSYAVAGSVLSEIANERAATRYTI